MLEKFFVLVGVLLIFLLAGLSDVHARREPIAKRDVGVPCAMSLEKVKKGIRRGLSVRNWHAVEKEPGVMVATIYVRRHVLILDIMYDTNFVRIRYKDSENLNYTKKGKEEFIHSGANKWIRNVAIDIGRGLSSYCS